MDAIALYSTPVLILIILFSGVITRQPVYELFVEGAKEGLQICLRIFPYILGMMVAVAVFRSGGALDILARVLQPICNLFNTPSEVLPLALMWPMSGSGALGLTADIIESAGPDSYTGLLASVMQGSTDTTLYILAVYFGVVGIKKYRYALPVGLSADMVSFLAAAIVCQMFFT